MLLCKLFEYIVIHELLLYSLAVYFNYDNDMSCLLTQFTHDYVVCINVGRTGLEPLTNSYN